MRQLRVRIFLNAILLFSGLIVSSSCNSNNAETSDQTIKDINVQESDIMIKENQNNPDFIILDTRTTGEYNNGHLLNSVFIDYSSSNFKQEIEKLDRTKKYLIYCHSGGRSKTTLNLMKKLGFKEAYNMMGGIVAWTNAGFKLVK